MLLTEYNEAEVMELFKEDGRKEGRSEGRERLLIEQVYKKLSKGMCVELIADALEEDENHIKKIVATTEKYAPEYDVYKILSELNSVREQAE